MKQWSKGRVTLVGDASHSTSPYAAYGAGMSIEDGYFLALELSGVEIGDTGAVSRALQAFEDRRKPHCARVTQEAFMAGKVFHHTPRPLIPLREFLFDRTPLLQKAHGDSWPKHAPRLLAEIGDLP